MAHSNNHTPQANPSKRIETNPIETNPLVLLTRQKPASSRKTAEEQMHSQLGKLCKVFPSNESKLAPPTNPFELSDDCKTIISMTEAHYLDLFSEAERLTISGTNTEDEIKSFTRALNLLLLLTSENTPDLQQRFLKRIEKHAKNFPPKDNVSFTATSQNKVMGICLMILGAAIIAFVGGAALVVVAKAAPAAAALASSTASSIAGGIAHTTVGANASSTASSIAGGIAHTTVGAKVITAGSSAATSISSTAVYGHLLSAGSYLITLGSQCITGGAAVSSQIGTYLTQHGVTAALSQASTYFAQSGTASTLALGAGYATFKTGENERKGKPDAERKTIKTLRDIHAQAEIRRHPPQAYPKKPHRN